MTEQGQSLPGTLSATSPASTIVVPQQPRRAGTLWGDAMRRLRRDRGAMAGLLVVVLVTLLAILAPVIAPYDPIKINSSATLQPPSLQYLLGTDHLGRDIFSRILYGGQVSL